MTKPTSTAARCDQIISLIDECLSAVVSEGHRTTTTRMPTQRADLVRS